MGQYQINQDGRLLDANNRIGSGGVNGPGDKSSLTITGNDILYGNVTGGWEFRGRTSVRDTFEFRGRMGSASYDRFVRNTVGGYESVNTNTNRSRYYGDSYGAPAPQGFQTIRGTGAIRPEIIQPRLGSDARLGYIPGYSEDIRLPLPGTLVLPGPVDPTANRTIFAASPVYGVREFGLPADPGSDLSTVSGAYRPRLAGFDDVTAAQLRQEVERTMVRDETNTPGAPARGGTKDESNDPNARDRINSATPLNQRGNGANGTSLGAQPVLPNNVSVKPIETGIDVNRPRSFRDAATLQSSQYAELQERYRLHRERKKPVSNAPAGGVAPGAEKSTDTVPDDSAPAEVEKPGVTDFVKRSHKAMDEAMKSPDHTEGETPDGTKDASPLKFNSLATGMKAKGLEELLLRAEELMREGKFASAIESYDAAARAAPENPLVWMGRANAELGASYYARAEENLRKAFTADPSLLLAQYDLKTFYGDDRLQYLVKDLKDIASKDKTNVRSLFLLSYIAYNTSNERRAAAYLELAEKRAGGDELLKLLREHWTLPKDSKPEDADLNK